MKKLITIMLTGAMVLGACACSKTGDKKSSNNETGAAQTDSDGTPEIGSDEYYQSLQYFVDPTSETEIKKVLDALYAGEPKLGDDADSIYKKVVGAIGDDPIEASMYGNSNTYNFEYGWDSNIDILDGKDRLIYMGYWNYETDDDSNGACVGYEESYINPTRPGAGNCLLYVYDEGRAKTAYDIISKYLKAFYAEYNPEIKEDSLMGYQLKCGEGGLEYYAYVRILHEDGTNIWKVYTEVFFADPDLIAASGLDTKETTSASETSESTENAETEDTTDTSETEIEA